MATEVVMPQMGESIAEGTITRWLKKLGEQVERDEPLFEISTDKVDAEIPSPAAGTLTEVRFKEGETVEVNTVVAVLDGAPGAAAEPPAPKPVEAQPAPAPPAPAPPVQQAAPTPPPAETGTMQDGSAASQEELRRTKSSPLVRKIAQEHGVDISRLEGTGLSGRVTKNDILSFIESGTSAAPQPTAQYAAPPPASAPAPQQEIVAPTPPKPQIGDR